MLDLAEKYGKVEEEPKGTGLDLANKYSKPETKQVSSGLDLAIKYGGETPTLTGGVKQEVTRPFKEKFEDRPSRYLYDLEKYNESEKNLGDRAKLVASFVTNTPKEIVGNLGKDIKDVGTGLGSLIGKGVYEGIPYTGISGKNFMRLVKGENPLDYYASDVEATNQFFRDLPQTAKTLGEGIKEGYGQKGIDMFQWDDKTKPPKIQFNLGDYAQSLYAHPLNLLDFLGVGEIGKVGAIAKATRGGQASKFAKKVGNVTVNPKYSKNLVLQAGERFAETPAVQNIVNYIDKTPLRAGTDIVADFLGLSPESRLLGEQGSNVRKAKLTEQKYQTKNIAERNKAIAQNREALSGLSEAEAKQLIQNIESGRPTDYVAPEQVLEQKPKTTILRKSDLQKDFNSQLKAIKDSIEVPEITKGQYQHGRYKNKFYIKNITDDITQGIIEADTALANTIKEIKKNPEVINTDFDRLEQQIIQGIDRLPNDETLRMSYYEKFYDSINKAGEYNNLKGSSILPENLGYVEEITKPLEPIIKEPTEQIARTRQDEIRQALKEKAEANAEFYTSNQLLKPETVEQLPVNTYAARKYNKPIVDLTDAEKVDALKDIKKMPDEQKPFYVPIMYDENLRASDFFADTTKRYKPGELKQRKSGLGLEKNSRGANRIYDPVELANRLDVHRIKMVNTENMIKEITENFAKPYNRKTDKLLDGYVEFNPDSFLNFYKGAIDINEQLINKLNEIDDIDAALKQVIADSINKSPEDIVEYLGVTKRNNIYQIPKEVMDTLKYGKDKKKLGWAIYDMATAGFKRNVLGLSWKWFVNNRIGNGIMAGLKGVNLKNYMDAFKIPDNLIPEEVLGKSMYEAEKTIIGRTGGGDRGWFGNTMRLLGGEFLDNSDLKGLAKTKADLANTLAIPGKVVNSITDAAFKFNQKFETFERKAAYMRGVDKIGKKMMKTTGQNITKQEELLKYAQTNPELQEQLIKFVDDTLGDYINMTAVERRGIRKLVPFYSWFRTITRYTLSLAETNPIRADLANKISIALNELNEDEGLPEYQKGSIPTEFYSDITGKSLRLGYTRSVPFNTFTETTDSPLGMISPLVTIPIEAAFGRSSFTGQPYTSPYYENLYGGGYGSLDEMEAGKYYNELPSDEKLKSVGVNYLRTAIPGLQFAERVGAGSLYNLLKNGQIKPFDKLYDTALGGYNYDEFGYKRPKGFSTREQLLRYFLPIQQEGKPQGARKIKRETR